MSQVLTHSFSIPVAKVVGVHGAIILQHFAFWHLANWGNSKNYHDGRFWTFNSIKAYSELFPYMTAKEIRGQLNRLERDEYIISSNYNATQFNRTKWYAMTSLGLDLMQIDESKRHLTKGQMDVTKGQIDSAKGQMNDRYNTDINTVNNSLSPASEIEPSTVEAKKDKEVIPAGGAAARIEISDSPKAKTPTQLEDAMKNFYRQWTTEWTDGVCRRAGEWIKDDEKKGPRIVSLLSDFVTHAITHNSGGDTYGMLNAAFQKWVRNEKHAAWKDRPARNGNSQSSAPGKKIVLEKSPYDRGVTY